MMDDIFYFTVFPLFVFYSKKKLESLIFSELYVHDAMKVKCNKYEKGGLLLLPYSKKLRVLWVGIDIKHFLFILCVSL